MPSCVLGGQELRIDYIVKGQMRRVMALNHLDHVTAEVVQAARDCLVIGPGT